MRILIAGDEVCGIMKTYQVELQNLGHQVFSAIHIKDRYFSEYKYDFFLGSLRPKIPFTFFGKEILLLKKIVQRVQSIRLRKFLRNRVTDYDLVIYMWRTILTDSSDVKMFRKNGAKIVFLFLGAEVRYYEIFQKKYDAYKWDVKLAEMAREEFVVPIVTLLRYVRIAEKYGDLIYGVPDQEGLQVRPYYHLEIPIDTKKFEFQNNFRKIPKVIHAPSHPWHKGSDLIEATIERLKNEGVEFEYVRLKGVPNHEVIAYLKDCDVLVDEINGHGPGILAFEAMSCGCVILTKHLAEYAHVFAPPLVHIDSDNIYESVKKVILDYELRQELIVKGRAYVERKNEGAVLAKDLLENLNNPRKEDYFPALAMDLLEDSDKKIVEKWSNSDLY